jgi:hypothetical protein
MAKQTLKDPETVESKVEEIVATPKEELVSPKPESKPQGSNPEPQVNLGELVQMITELKKQNSMLLEVADKKALSNYYQRNQKDVPSMIRIRSIDGGVIKSWKTIENDVYKDYNTGRWTEKQTLEVDFFIGESKKYNLVDFNRRFEYIECTKVGQIIDDISGSVTLKLKRSDTGEEISIDVRYVN